MKPVKFSIAKYLPVLFLVIFISFFAHLGSLPLFDGDEGAYSEVTREMLENRNFTSALLNDFPFFHKPPLFYWAQAVSINILGFSEFSMRLPSALAALLWATSIFLFARRFLDTAAAWHATLFMASSLLVTIVGRAATPEAMTNLFLTLSTLNIYRFSATGNRRHIYWVFMFAGLGVLTKGSLAILIPILVGFLFFGLGRRWKEFLLLFNPVALTVFGLIVLPWYFAQFMLFGEAFLSDLFLLQSPQIPGLHFIGISLPIYTYPVLLLFGLMPNTGFFLKAMSRVKKLFSDDLARFMIIWSAVAFFTAPLSVPGTPFALAYCLPPLFIIMAKVADSARRSFYFLIWPLLLTGLLCLIPDIAPYVMGSIDSGYARTAVAEGSLYFDAYYRLTLGAILLLLLALPFIKEAPGATKIGISGLLFVGMLHFLVIPILGNTLQVPIKSAALMAKNEKLAVVTWKNFPPSFNLYSQSLTEYRSPEPGDTVLLRTVHLDELERYKILYKQHGIALAKILEDH